MSRPAVERVTDLVYGALVPFTAADEDLGWPLLLYIDAICQMFTRPFEAGADADDDRSGWEVILTVDDCPAWALPYLAQFAGVELAPSLSEQEQRDAIALPERFRRGTISALTAAVRRTLTGSKTVLITERETSAYNLRVRTLASETPDSAASEAAARSQKAGGLVLSYESITGMNWSDFDGEHADWTAAAAAYDDWDDARTTAP